MHHHLEIFTSKLNQKLQQNIYLFYENSIIKIESYCSVFKYCVSVNCEWWLDDLKQTLPVTKVSNSISKLFVNT